MSSKPGAGRERFSWKILRPEALRDWAVLHAGSDEDGLAVLEFVKDRLLIEPDFGEEIDEHTRGEIAPGTTVEVIWTFDPEKRYVEVITPLPPLP